MPTYRKVPLVSGEIYHVFNRSVGRIPIFLMRNDFQRAIEVLKFYRFNKPSLRFSHYNRLPAKQKIEFIDHLTKINNQLVEIICFCLMPNHVHFLLKNLITNGISTFMSNFQNSYAKYFNTKNERDGSLFQTMFKAVRIETDEQLVHVSRYIHLNPVTAFIKEMEDLPSYEWSSYLNYLDNEPSYIQKDTILNLFKSLMDYKKFLADQVDYQRQLDKIKHIILE